MARHHKRLKVRATVICLCDGEILLVRKRGRKWNFPGGTIEAGELPVEAAMREMKEEASLQLEGLLALCTLKVSNRTHYIFTAQLDSKRHVSANHEIYACKWIRHDRLSRCFLTTMATALVATQLPVLTGG